MAKGNILKEAIADAKAVREVALANAKAALEEAFTPKLNRMLSAKLSEDLDETYYDEDEKDMDEGMGMYDEDDKDIELGEMMYDEDDVDEAMYDEDEKVDEMMYDEDEDNSMDEEIDLEEILNELETEGSDAEKTVDEAKDDDEEVDLDEIMVPHDPKADDVSKVNPSADPSNIGYIHEDEKFDLDALLEEINSLDKKPIKKVSSSKRIRTVGKKINENNTVNKRQYNGCRETGISLKETKEELEKVKQAYSSVKTELNEVNLLNSKLLYVNRIFKANSLDDSQKLRVVETLDKAGSVKEAKLIYETIKDSFSISNDVKKSNRKPKKHIRENLGMASKAAGMSRTKTTAPKRAIINESDTMVSRFQKLANIKINE